jgi:methylated-DNA-[protein]-cysteine S-methyltransferase
MGHTVKEYTLMTTPTTTTPTTTTPTTTTPTTTTPTTTTMRTTTQATDRHLARTVTESPIGELTIIATDDAIVAINFGNQVIGSRPTDVVDVPAGEHAVLDEAVRQLDEYFAGERVDFDLPLEPAGTPFQRQAWTALSTIPYGETISYGEQAMRLGDRNKSRAVGAANGKNPLPIVVPCHRVIGANGHLTGFGGGLDIKAWLLDHELRVRAGSR